jgi:hydroxymethylpyrimidine pyrophosphatase-like HAD family hydrolase
MHARTKLILCDIDNTILPHGRGRVSQRTIDAFHAALAAGIHVGPASGRGVDWIPPFFGGDRACCATCLATNGLQVYLDGKLVHEQLQPHDALVRLAEILADTPCAGLLCFDDATPLLVAGSREDLEGPFPAYAERCVPVDAVPARVVKANVFVGTDETGTRELIARLSREVPELDFDYALLGYSNVMPRGYNKGSGARMLCDLLGIGADEAVAFGDGGNDLPLFSAVPNSVAIANAQPEAAAAARWHIGRCDEDAVAKAIEALAAGEWPFSA